MKYLAISVFAAAALVGGAVLPSAAAAGNKVDFDQLRRENLDKDAVNIDELRQENLEKGNKVDFDQLRRENLDKGNKVVFD
jgi:hypothetical protein